jgi:hypothetical protein
VAGQLRGWAWIGCPEWIGRARIERRAIPWGAAIRWLALRGHRRLDPLPIPATRSNPSSAIVVE